MRLALTGRHVDVTPALRQLVTRRLAKLERLLNDHALSTQVVLDVEKRNFKTEITVHARGDNFITGKGSGTTWTQSVSAAAEKVMQQALKVKDKWVTRKRGAPGGKGVVNGRAASLPAPRLTRAALAGADGAAIANAGGDAGAAATRAESRASAFSVRPTKYAVKPMSLEDAAVRMENAREPFVVFRHVETERITILYQRPDGRLGLIDPEA
jgi:putative sigma-54 modulation protein